MEVNVMHFGRIHLWYCNACKQHIPRDHTCEGDRMSARKNLTQPPDWWAAFQAQAKQDGQSLSEWAGDCMMANLPGDVSVGLSSRPPAHRPKRVETFPKRD
jgi:predicted RNA-binding protein with PUA domain